MITSRLIISAISFMTRALTTTKNGAKIHFPGKWLSLARNNERLIYLLGEWFLYGGGRREDK